MKPLLNCNRCDKEFTSANEQTVDYHKGVARSRLELCPHCGMFDAHYIFEKKQPVTITPQKRQQLKKQLAERMKIRRRKEDERRQHIYK